MDLEKITNSFEKKKYRLPDHLLNNSIFTNDFLKLLL